MGRGIVRGSQPVALAPRLARTILLVIVGIYVFTALLNTMADDPSPEVFAFSTVCVLVMFSVQFLHALTGLAPRSWPYKVGTLTVQAFAAYAPLAIFGKSWTGMWGPLAATALLLLPPVAAWPLFAVAVLSPLALPLWFSMNVVDTSYLFASGLLGALVLYGLTRLTELVQEVYAARAELARMAVTQERLRFARDLHDLLGYSLSAITLKSELTHRLVLVRPERARDEIDSILEISRQALADVRMVASGYRDMSLVTEARSAQTMLEATGIETRLTCETHNLHPAIETVLATTLREGVTNILRHSKVQRCELDVRQEEDGVRMTLVNDGVQHPTAPRAQHSGSGLGNLANRVAAVGGALEAGVADDREHFHLTVWTPPKPVPGPRAVQAREDGQEREAA